MENRTPGLRSRGRHELRERAYDSLEKQLPPAISPIAFEKGVCYGDFGGGGGSVCDKQV